MQSTLTKFFKRASVATPPATAVETLVTAAGGGPTSRGLSPSKRARPSSVEEAASGIVEETTDGKKEDGKGKDTKPSSVLVATTTTTVIKQTGASWADAEIERLDPENGWRDLLLREAARSTALFTFLQTLPDNKVLPPKRLVFEAFRLCPFDQVRVVILGQDPYHGPGQAHGLAFSVMKGVQIPPSLRNIFKEASNDVGARSGPSGYLESWAKQGVLMLNALLTVEPGKPMAHKGRGWEKFTDACIEALSKERSNLVFMLWGKPAQEKGRIVDRSKHLVITSSHPSPLGASQTAEPFLGSKCFSRCNAYLEKQGFDKIDWNVPS